jgi:hypothetical protein
MCCNDCGGFPELFFAGSTSFFLAHFIVRFRIAAARGSLHVSHLILGR